MNVAATAELLTVRANLEAAAASLARALEALGEDTKADEPAPTSGPCLAIHWDRELNRTVFRVANGATEEISELLDAEAIGLVTQRLAKEQGEPFGAILVAAGGLTDSFAGSVGALFGLKAERWDPERWTGKPL